MKPCTCEDSQIGLIESLSGDIGVGRNHRDLCANARVDDEVLAGGGCNRFRNLRDVRVLEVRGDALLRLPELGARRLLRSPRGWLCIRKRGYAEKRYGTACEEAKTFH